MGILLGAVLVTTVSQSGHAIIRRHDVPDEKYLAYGQKFQNLVGLIRRPQERGFSLGAGTLVGDRWVLTAAHVATGRIKEGAKISVEFAGVEYSVAEVIPNSNWRRGEGNFGDDIALLRLEKPVPNASIACFYDSQREKNRVVALAGYGIPGDGVTGPADKADRKLRAAQMIVEEVTESSIAWKFRGPGDPKALALAGISGPGDSGGPALIFEKGRWCVAGVSSQQRDPDQVGEGRYGVIENYARVSFHKKWLEAVLGGERPPSRPSSTAQGERG